jgi:hypothetical protein
VTSVFKQVVILCGFWLALVFTITAPAGKRMAVVRYWLRIAAAGLLFWATVAMIFLLAGNYDDFYQAVFEYNSEYSGNWIDNLETAFERDHLLPGYMKFLWPLGLLTLFGVAAGLVRSGTRRFSFAFLALCVATFLQVGMPGKFFPHYYQLWLPVAVIGAAWGLARVPSAAAAAGAGLATVALLLWTVLPAYRESADDWSRSKYGDEFVIDKMMAAELSDILRPGETFFHWGNQPSLYFDTRISPPSGVFFGLMLVSPTVGGPLTERLLADLQRQPPDLYVESLRWGYCPACDPLIRWRNANYRRLENTIRHGSYQLYARIGSALAQRYHVKE